VCKLEFLLSAICCLLSKHWYWFRGIRTSSSGEGLTKWVGIEGKTNLGYFRDLSFYATR
jgi:hypothetical protein